MRSFSSADYKWGRTDARLRLDLTARRAVAEPLEARRLFTIATASWFAPYLEHGSSWTFHATNGTSGVTVTQIQTDDGPTTFDGQSCYDVALTDPTDATRIDDYDGTDTAGDFVEYGEHDALVTTGPVTVTDDVYSPYEAELPATLTAGVPQSFTDTDTYTPAGGTGTTETDTFTFTLQSEMPAAVTVPAGTFQAYELIEVNTSTAPDGSSEGGYTEDAWVSPGVGLVKDVDPSDGSTTVLVTAPQQDHLAFAAPIPTTATGAAIQPPVVVDVDNADGTTDLDASGSVTVMLQSASQPMTSTGTLGGTTTQPIVDGAATFNSLTVSQAGTYQLQASDGDGASVNSAPFDVSADHLVFTRQPASGDIKEPITFTVTAYTPKDKVDADASGDATVSLSTLKGGVGAALTGQTTVSLVDGSAAFTAGDDDAVAQVGEYQLTADFAGAADGTAVQRAAAATRVGAAATRADIREGLSKPFSLSGFQLVFTQPIPEKNDPDALIDFTVELEDKDHKPVTADDGNYVQVTDAENETAGPSATYNATYAQLDDGVARFSGEAAIRFKNAGKFAIRVDEVSGVSTSASDDSVVVATTNGAVSRPFAVVPLRLVFTEQPSTEVAGDPVQFQVALRDFDDRTVTTEDQYDIDVSKVAQVVPEQQGTAEYGSIEIVDGVASFTGGNGITFQQAGTYSIEVQEATAAATPSAPIQYAPYTQFGRSKLFRVIT